MSCVKASDKRLEDLRQRIESAIFARNGPASVPTVREDTFEERYNRFRARQIRRNRMGAWLSPLALVTPATVLGIAYLVIAVVSLPILFG